MDLLCIIRELLKTYLDNGIHRKRIVNCATESSCSKCFIHNENFIPGISDVETLFKTFLSIYTNVVTMCCYNVLPRDISHFTHSHALKMLLTKELQITGI